MNGRYTSLFVTLLMTASLFATAPGLLPGVTGATINAWTPADNSVIRGNTLFTMTDAGAATAAALSIDGVLVASMTGPSPNWQTTVNTRGWADGYHTVRFDSTAGNGGNAAKTIALNFDNNAPSVSATTVNYPGIQTAARKGDTVSVSARIADTASGTNTVRCNSTGLGYIDNLQMFDDGLHYDSIAGDGIFGCELKVNITAAYQAVYIVTTDVAGNERNVSAQVDVDTYEPTVQKAAVILPGAQTAVKYGDKVRVVAEAQDFHIEIKNVTSRVPFDVTMVIDNSGSMAGQKWTDLKTAAKGFIDRMNDTDRVAFYGFTIGGEDTRQLMQFKDVGNLTTCDICGFAGTGRNVAKHVLDAANNHFTNGLNAPSSWTPIWDTTGAGITYTLNNFWAANGHLPAVVALTDGNDEGTAGRETGSEAFCPGCLPNATNVTWPNPSPPNANPIYGGTWGIATGNVFGDPARYYDGVWRVTANVPTWTSYNLDAFHDDRTGLVNASIPVFTIGLATDPQSSNATALGYYARTNPQYNYTTEYDLWHIANTSRGGQYFFAPGPGDLDLIFQNISKIIVNITVDVLGLKTPHGIPKVTADVRPLGLAGSETMYDDGNHGDNIADDGTFGSDLLVVSTRDTGLKTIRVTATDIAGNQNFSIALVWLDNGNPQVINVTIAYPSGQNYVEDDQTINITANVTDSYDGFIRRVFADASAFGGNSELEMCDDGNHGDGPANDSIYGTGPIPVMSGNLQDSYKMATVWGVDVADNTFSNASSIYINNIPPYVSLLDPLKGAYVHGTVNLKIDTGSSHGLTITSPSYRVDGGAWTTMAGAGGTTYSANWNTAGITDGVHTVDFQTIDDHRMSTTQTAQFVVDNTNPSVAIQSPMAAGYIEGKHTFKVAASDAMGIASVNITLGGRAPFGGLMVLNPQTGYFEYLLDTTMYADGAMTVNATVTDLAGNSVTTQTVSFNTDNNLPALAVVSPAANAYVAGMFDISVSADDAFLPAVDFAVDAGGWSALTVTGIAPNFTVTGSWNTNGLADGGHSLVFRARDPAGHTVTRTIWVYVDNKDPTSGIVAPQAGQFVEGVMTFKVFASDTNGIAAVVLSGSAAPLNHSLAYNGASGLWELSVDTRLLPDGDYLLSATITETAGLRAPVRIVLDAPFSVDNHAPALTITAPAQNEQVSGMYDITALNADAYPGSLQYRVDSGPWNDVVSEAGWNTLASSDGRHVVEVRSADLAGHSITERVGVIVDNTAPVCAFSSPARNEFAEGGFVFRVAASDAVGVSSVTLDLDGTSYRMEYSAASGAYELEFDTTILKDGRYTAITTARDAIGHATNASVSFKVDNHAPVLEVTAPRAQDRLAGTVSFYANASDAFLSSVEYSIDGGAWKNISTSIDTAQFNDGRHSLTLRASDESGHSTAVTVDVYTDNASPAIEPGFLFAEGAHVAGDVEIALYVRDTVGVSRVTVTTGSNTTVAFFDQSSGLYRAIIRTGDLRDGPQTARFTARDAVGHESSFTRGFVADNTAPSVTVKQTADFGTVIAVATVSDTSPVRTVWVRIDGGAWKEMDRSASDSSRYSFSWKTSVSDNGDHKIEVRAGDSLGNEQTIRSTLSVRNPDYWWAPLLIIMIVFVIVAVLALSRRRREPQMPVTAPSETVEQARPHVYNPPAEPAAAPQTVAVEDPATLGPEQLMDAPLAPQGPVAEPLNEPKKSLHHKHAHHEHAGEDTEQKAAPRQEPAITANTPLDEIVASLETKTSEGERDADETEPRQR